MNVEEKKQKIREYVWRIMEEKNIARFPRPVYGRVPNFVGAEEAAKRLTKLPEFRKAEVVFVNPDSPQHPVRALSLLEGKKVIMASPRIKRGFILLDPEKIPTRDFWRATTIKGAFRYGRIIHPSQIHVDIKITGSVAVDTVGGRVGKGHGYSDIEYGILREYGAIDEDAPIITTVHDIQIVDHIPMTNHDMPVDIILTPTKVIRTNTPYKKPRGVFWELLTEKDLEEIPLLKELYMRRRQK
ncbi:MAG: 5-formyltetrahydrofolate cyclo-ligase [Candidatus Njordarchaeales archaeon]